MYDVDKTIGVIILVCWLIDMLQDILLVWIDSRTAIVVQQLFAQSVSKDQLFPILLKLFVAKVALCLFMVGVQRLRRDSEVKIKKKLRVTMTVMLIDSFCSLDLATQNDPTVVRDFQESQGLFYCSVVNRTNDVLTIVLCVARILFLLGSLVMQTRGREELMVLPIVATLFAVECFILHGNSTFVTV